MRNETRRVRQAGIALVCVTFLIVLCGALATAFLTMGRYSRVGAVASLQASQAGLATASGLEYASSRLWQDRRPVAEPDRASFNAADDWTCRGPDWCSRSSKFHTVSYARGDRWEDDSSHLTDGIDNDSDGRIDEPAEGSGLWTPDESWTDVDGNGRFTPVSGRLRGDGPSFRLKIKGDRGLVCVNSGEIGSTTGDHDMDGVPNGSDTDYSLDLDGNGIPDYRDPDYIGNRHLVNLLNNLGGVLGAPFAFQGDYAPVPPASPNANDRLNDWKITSSFLGEIVVLQRPRGGYAATDILADLLGADVGSCLTVHGEIIPVGYPEPGATFSLNAPEERFEFHARIAINAAPLEVVKALLRNITVDVSSQNASQSTFARLREEEADRIAEAIVAARPLGTWEAVVAVLDGSLFSDDPFSQGNSKQVSEKRALILAQLAADGCFPDPFGGILTRIGQVKRTFYHFNLVGPYSTAPYDSQGYVVTSDYVSGIPDLRTTECTLTTRPSGAFEMACSGRVSSPASRDGLVEKTGKGTIEIERSLVLTSQQDFDPPERDLGWRYGNGCATAETIARRQGVQSAPRFPLTSAFTRRPNFTPQSITNPPSADVLRECVHSRSTYGELRLAQRQLRSADVLNACLALPNNEDDVASMGARYGPDRWDDNCFDPFIHPLPPDPPEYVNWTSSPVPEPREFYRGFRVGPAGTRDLKPNGAFSQWATSPFPRESFYPDPRLQLPPVDGAGFFSGGLIEGWYFHHEDSDKSILATVSIHLICDLWDADSSPPQSFPGQVLETSIFRVSDGRVRVGVQQMMLGSGLGGQAGNRWYHIACRFDHSGLPPDSNSMNVRIYVDGQLKGSAEVEFQDNLGNAVAVPVSDTILFSVAGLDDVRFYPPPFDIDDEALRSRAAQDRFERQGSYTSPRLTFDAARFPAGVAVTGLEWEAHFPTKAQGSFDFTVVGYDAFGARLPGDPPASWDGTGDPSLEIKSGPRCKSIEIETTIRTDPASYDEILGQPVLLDTPLLNECRLYYKARPRWTTVD